MRCYEVSTVTDGPDQNGQPTEIKHIQYAGTQADARAHRDHFVETLGVKKKDVTIEETEIPTAKGDLLAFINGLLTKKDGEE